jgi:RNA polymerase-binding transcription factor DksA
MDEAVLYPLGYQLTLARIIRETMHGPAMEAALARLNRSDFGACAGCGSVIPYVDISAEPATRFCKGCRR